jgi:hypothetical protein
MVTSTVDFPGCFAKIILTNLIRRVSQNQNVQQACTAAALHDSAGAKSHCSEVSIE